MLTLKKARPSDVDRGVSGVRFSMRFFTGVVSPVSILQLIWFPLVRLPISLLLPEILEQP